MKLTGRTVFRSFTKSTKRTILYIYNRNECLQCRHRVSQIEASNLQFFLISLFHKKCARSIDINTNASTITCSNVTAQSRIEYRLICKSHFGRRSNFRTDRPSLEKVDNAGTSCEQEAANSRLNIEYCLSSYRSYRPTPINQIYERY